MSCRVPLKGRSPRRLYLRKEYTPFWWDLKDETALDKHFEHPKSNDKASARRATAKAVEEVGTVIGSWPRGQGSAVS